MLIAKALNCIGELSKKMDKQFLLEELQKVDFENMRKISEKKRVLNIFESLLTYELVETEALNTQIQRFCLDNIQAKSQFGFRCEVFRFLQRAEMRDVLAQVAQVLDAKELKTFYEVVQNE